MTSKKYQKSKASLTPQSVLAMQQDFINQSVGLIRTGGRTGGIYTFWNQEYDTEDGEGIYFQMEHNVVVTDQWEGCPHFKLCSVSVAQDSRKLGIGTIAMNWVCDLADKHQVEIRIGVQPFNASVGMNKARLIKWYRKFGFKQLPLKDYSRGQMYRLPKPHL